MEAERDETSIKFNLLHTQKRKLKCKVSKIIQVNNFLFFFSFRLIALAFLWLNDPTEQLPFHLIEMRARRKNSHR